VDGRKLRLWRYCRCASFHRRVSPGIRKQWNDGREARAADIDDVGFLHRLVTALVGRGIADPKQIYIAGVSNGGMMTFRMLCEASELFAGAATVIANMPARIGASCAPRKPMPVVMFNGTADPLVPYDGGGVGFLGGRGSVWAAEETAEFMPTSTPARLRVPCRYRVHGAAVCRRQGSNGRTAEAAARWRSIALTAVAIRCPANAHSCRFSSVAGRGR